MCFWNHCGLQKDFDTILSSYKKYDNFGKRHQYLRVNWPLWQCLCFRSGVFDVTLCSTTRVIDKSISWCKSNDPDHATLSCICRIIGGEPMRTGNSIPLVKKKLIQSLFFIAEFSIFQVMSRADKNSYCFGGVFKCFLLFFFRFL